MLSIDVRAEGVDERFSTNGDGSYFFIVSDGSLKQIFCDSGYNSLRQMKKTIREYLTRQLLKETMDENIKLPRLTYKIVGNDDRWHK